MTTDNSQQSIGGHSLASLSQAESTLDTILMLQVLVAWAGEGLCEPKRLGWWRTDLVDESGGGDLIQRLLPRTHQWASLEAVRQVAIQYDKQARRSLAQPDQIHTLFFWGFAIDERLAERFAFHKREGEPPMTALPFLLELSGTFSSAEFEAAICPPGQQIDFKVVPGGRELVGKMPEGLELRAKKLATGLIPLTDSYPMPFYRVGGIGI